MMWLWQRIIQRWLRLAQYSPTGPSPLPEESEVSEEYRRAMAQAVEARERAEHILKSAKETTQPVRREPGFFIDRRHV